MCPPLAVSQTPRQATTKPGNLHRLRNLIAAQPPLKLHPAFPIWRIALASSCGLTKLWCSVSEKAQNPPAWRTRESLQGVSVVRRINQWLGLWVACGSLTLGGAAALAARPSETLLPKETVGFWPISNLQTLDAQWKKDPDWGLDGEPHHAPFRKDLAPPDAGALGEPAGAFSASRWTTCRACPAARSASP